MRFAYADPPYPGNARKHYGEQPDFAGEVDHGELVERLERDFPDGWLLSTGAKNLAGVLAHCPEGEMNPKRPGMLREGTGVRVLSWVKPMHPYFDGLWLQYGWEPVILRGGRRCPGPARSKPLDVLIASPEGYSFRPTPDEHLVGQKPPAFWTWIFEAIGAEPEDEFVDIFPGSGAGAREWSRWQQQPVLPRQEHPRDSRRAQRRATAQIPEATP